MFWSQLQFKNLPEVIGLSDAEKNLWGSKRCS